MERIRNWRSVWFYERVKFFSVLVINAYVRPAIAASRKSPQKHINESRQVIARTRGIKTGGSEEKGGKNRAHNLFFIIILLVQICFLFPFLDHFGQKQK